MNGSPGRSSFFSARLGVSVLVVGGGCGGGLGGVGGFGGGGGLRRPCVGGGGGGGGLGLSGRGIAPSSLLSDDSKEHFRFLRAGWGGLGFSWGGVFGAVVMDPSPPPLLPLAHPAPTHALPHLLILPRRVPHLLHPSPLCGPEVARRHPYVTHHGRSLPIADTAQEIKA